MPEPLRTSANPPRELLDDASYLLGYAEIASVPLLSRVAKDKPKSEDKNDFYTNTMEREAGKSEGEAVALQTLREKIRDSIDALIASPIPEESKAVVLSSIIHDISEACKGNVPPEGTPQKREPQEEAPPTPDLSAIPSWRGRKRDGMPLDFLKRHYGQWLAAFGAKEDSVFQDQIRAHDPGFLKGIDNQFREEGQGRKVSDFVKTRSARIDRELESITARALEKNVRLVHTLSTRMRRAGEASRK